MPIAQYGISTGYDMSAVGGEASQSLTGSLTRSLAALAIYDTDELDDLDSRSYGV